MCLGHRHQLEVGCYEPYWFGSELVHKATHLIWICFGWKKDCFVLLLLLGMGRQKVSYEGGPTPS